MRACFSESNALAPSQAWCLKLLGISFENPSMILFVYLILVKASLVSENNFFKVSKNRWNHRTVLIVSFCLNSQHCQLVVYGLRWRKGFCLVQILLSRTCAFVSTLNLFLFYLELLFVSLQLQLVIVHKSNSLLQMFFSSVANFSIQLNLQKRKHLTWFVSNSHFNWKICHQIKIATTNKTQKITKKISYLHVSDNSCACAQKTNKHHHATAL